MFWQVAELIASEFFEQGDIEKQELNMMPSDVMDRDKSSELPRMQIEFIDAVCMPIYEVRHLRPTHYEHARNTRFHVSQHAGKITATR